MTSVSIRDLTLKFGSLEVLKSLNLDIDEGEFLVLFGEFRVEFGDVGISHGFEQRIHQPQFACAFDFRPEEDLQIWCGNRDAMPV